MIKRYSKESGFYKRQKKKYFENNEDLLSTQVNINTMYLDHLTLSIIYIVIKDE